jgi:hypothetical protein
MNTGNIEKAFVAALQDALQNESPLLTVVKKRDDEDLPADSSYAIVSVDRCDHLAGKLWKATVTVSVMSPAPILTESQHSEFVAKIVGFIEGAFFYDKYNENTLLLGHVCAGGKLLNAEGNVEGNYYSHALSIMLGIVAS